MQPMQPMSPSARRSDVIVKDVSPDLLVYDQLRDAAHSLNPVAGYVYRHADGTRSVAELTAGMSPALGVADDQRLTEAALWQLERASLLDAPEALAAPANVSRREAVRRFGAAALAVAAVTSIAAPTPAMAQSRGSLGHHHGPPPGHGPGTSNGRGPGGGGPPGQNKKHP